MPRLWGGRYEGEIDPMMARFNNSIVFDARLWEVDIRASQAYADALSAAKVLTVGERDQIVEGLDRVHEEWASGRFHVQEEDEDIHIISLEIRFVKVWIPQAGF